MAKKWSNVCFHGQRISKMAKLNKIGHEIANLATLCRDTCGCAVL